MKIEDAIKRYESWAEDDRIDVLIRKEHKQMADWLKELKADRPQGEWVLDPDGMDWNIPAWRCSRCGFVANYIGVEANGFGSNPMNWAGSNFCPNCGADMRGATDGNK